MKNTLDVHIDLLLEKARHSANGEHIELYSDLPVDAIIERMKFHEEYKAKPFNGFKNSIHIQKRVTKNTAQAKPFIESDALELLEKAKARIERLSKALDDEKISVVMDQVRCGELYELIEYYKDKTDLVVTKARGKVASLRFTMVRKKGTHYKYAFHEMAVGDYYSIGDDDNVTSVRVHASRMAKQLDMKFKVSAKDRRVWRVA